MKTLTVRGMHCEACKKLIIMEFEESGLGALVKDVEVTEEGKKGIFHLEEGATDKEIEKMKSIVNAMEGYSVE
ncbi:MAG: hypothetical protein ABII02_04870 [Candidatus Magasanikbacteria bacterium]